MGLLFKATVGFCFLLSSREEYVASSRYGPSEYRNSPCCQCLHSAGSEGVQGYDGGSRKLPQLHRGAQELGARVELYGDSPMEEGLVGLWRFDTRRKLTESAQTFPTGRRITESAGTELQLESYGGRTVCQTSL